MTHRLSRPRRVLLSLAAVLVAALLAGVDLPSALGGFIPKITGDSNTAATAPYFTCKSAAAGDTATRAYFAYPLDETRGTTADDESGNSRPGLYYAGGVSYGVANPASNGSCPRDNRTVVTLNGITGYVSGPSTAMSNPTVFTTEIWFRTSDAQGKLIGFGNARTGSSYSDNYDRHMYIDRFGYLRFGVYPNIFAGRRTISSDVPVDDGRWHYAAASLSGAGMALYLDGVLVDSDPSVTTARNYSGYWRIGWDDLTLWPEHAEEHFRGSLAFASVYTTALSAAQIKAHYDAGT